MSWEQDYVSDTEDWLDRCDGDDEEYDFGPGIDCDDDEGLGNIEYGGSYKDNTGYYSVNQDESINDDQNLDENEAEAEEDYNFGYGGNRHNRESGNRFHGLGRWRNRG